MSLSGRLGATGPSRMTPERSKEAARAPLGATNVLQSGTRVCRRAAMALESAARDHLETASALKSAAQACSRAAKPRKSMAQACITARKTARSSFVAALRSNVQLGISVLFAFAFVVFFVSVVDVACVSLVLGFSVVSVLMCVVGVRVCFVVSFRCRVYFCLRFSVMSVEATFQKYCSKVPHEIAARNYSSKSQVYVALGSVTPHSALPCYVHGYARVRTSIYIYIYIYI